MYGGQYVFAQVMDFLPLHVFRRCVARYSGEHRVKRFSCLDQYLCLTFAQLTWRESLRDIEAERVNDFETVQFERLTCGCSGFSAAD